MPTPTLNPRPATPATWRHTPQRVFLRRALFQLHLWTGILIAAYAIVIGLTGSALIFKTELLERIQPSLYTIHPVPRQTTLDATVRNIVATHPGYQAFALQNLDHPTQATDLLLRRITGPPTPNYRVVSFNPYTGQVLLDRLRYAGPLGFLSNLHVYLLSGETGLLISGWMALGLLILSLSGLILWWPGVQRWAAALFLHRRSSWRRTNFDLHTVLGFWTSAAFLLVILTGLDFAFPGPTGKLLELATLHGYRDTGVVLNPPIPPLASLPPASPHLAPPHPASPHLASPHLASRSLASLSLDDVIAAADRALPADAPPGYLQLPTTPASPIRVTGYYQHAAPYSQLVRIVLDPHTGALLASSDTRTEDLASRIEQYSVALHFGLFGGPGPLGLLVKILWVLLGILPALLAVTGILMYWNRKLRPLWHRLHPTHS
jgi:uncharacterized iron-regulated membrane protein